MAGYEQAGSSWCRNSFGYIYIALFGEKFAKEEKLSLVGRICAGRGEEWWMGGRKSEWMRVQWKKENLRRGKKKKLYRRRSRLYVGLMRYSQVIPRSFDGVKFGHKGWGGREKEKKKGREQKNFVCVKETRQMPFFPPLFPHACALLKNGRRWTTPPPKKKKKIS